MKNNSFILLKISSVLELKHIYGSSSLNRGFQQDSILCLSHHMYIDTCIHRFFFLNHLPYLLAADLDSLQKILIKHSEQNGLEFWPNSFHTIPGISIETKNTKEVDITKNIIRSYIELCNHIIAIVVDRNFLEFYVLFIAKIQFYAACANYVAISRLSGWLFVSFNFFHSCSSVILQPILNIQIFVVRCAKNFIFGKTTPPSQRGMILSLTLAYH